MCDTSAGAPTITTPETAAATVATPGGRVTAANGSAAAARTINTITCRTSQPGSPAIVARTGGAPSIARPPASIATRPPSIAAGTSGTTARLTTGETSDSRPNVARTSGSVAAWAASEIPRPSASQPGIRPPTEPSEALREGIGPRQQPRRGHDREPEPGILDHRGLDHQEERHGHPERRGRATRPSALPCHQRDARHDRRAHDRRRRSGGHDVRDHGPEDAERNQSSRSPAKHGGHERGDDRDVPAGDGDDMADAGRREVGGERPIDALSQPDEDPGRQPRLGLREGLLERVAAGIAKGLEAERRGVLEGERPALERARRARSSEVVAVRVVVGRWSKAPLDLDEVARRDGRERGERRRDGDIALFGVEAQPRNLFSLPRRPDRLHRRRPWTRVVGERRRRRGRRPEKHPDRQGDGASAGRDAGSAAGRRARRQCVRQREEHQPGDQHPGDRDPVRRRGRTAGDADRQPAAPRQAAARRAHGPTVTRARIFSSVVAPTTLRDAEVIDRRERLLLASGDDLGDRDRADPREGVQLLGRRAVEVDRAARPAAGRRVSCTADRSGGLASDRDVDLVAVVERCGEVELPVGEPDVDPRTEPAGGRHRVADPGPSRQPEHPGVGDGAAHLDDQHHAAPRSHEARARIDGGIRDAVRAVDLDRRLRPVCKEQRDRTHGDRDGDGGHRQPRHAALGRLRRRRPGLSRFECAPRRAGRLHG